MKRSAFLCSVLALSCLSVGCDVDVADDGRMPEVDVKPGNVPDVDVAGPEMRTEKRTVDVPVIEPAKEGEANAEEGE